MDDLVFLFDIDNTLYDNDAFQADLSAHLLEAFGPEQRDRYWAIFEELRGRLGYADYLGALQGLRADSLTDPRLLKVAPWLIDYPFASRVYSGALEAVKHVSQWGRVVVLSDGDAVFQPLKIDRSGIARAFADQILIYIHKEQELAEVERRYPARRYILVDDKLRILTAVKVLWRERVTTVFPRQGHYAADPKILASSRPPDIAIDRIGDLASFDPADFSRG
jgi:FMN phosphatase YigB (HAD superfamily)